MNLLQCHNIYQESLHAIHTKDEIRFIFKTLLKGLFGWDATALALSQQRKLTHSEIYTMEKALQDLLTDRPLQYIVGHTYFRGLKIEVNTATLIPRPETEELVGWLLEEVKEQRQKVLDIGTGSGCIALAIKSAQPFWHLTALDVSEKALATARRNSEQLNLEIEWLLLDITKGQLSEKFDCIIANPPYVTQTEKGQMKANVLDFEPHRALFVPDEDPLIFYRSIFDCAQKHLTEEGQIFFEINPNFSQELSDLALHYGFTKTEIRTDIFGKERLLRTQK